MGRSDDTFSLFLPLARGSRDAGEHQGTQSGGFAATPYLPLNYYRGGCLVGARRRILITV